jgi:hypothetical protein
MENNMGPIRIVGSNAVISPNRILKIRDWKDVRGAIEDILYHLDHKRHPHESWEYCERECPRHYMDRPKNALDILELLLDGKDSIYSRRDTQKVYQLVYWFMILLGEYKTNQNMYESREPRDPHKQTELYIAQQKITDIFHYLVWNMIDNKFQHNPQFWVPSIDDIQNYGNLFNSLDISKEFPNIKRTLAEFQTVFQENKGTHKAA